MAASTSVELQWDSLPCDLKELVLARLPHSELWRLHSVCRAWLSTLTSSHFHRLHRRLHPGSHASLLVYSHPLRISACEWRAGDASVAAVQDVSAVQESSLSNASPRAPSWRNLSVPVAFIREWVGTHALVCVRNHLTSSGFSVGCPFSNRWKTLPNPPRPPLLSKLWAMVPHTSTKHTSTFSVLLLQLNSPSVYLDVYNSESNEWTQRALPPQSSVTKVSFSSTPTCIGGLVYSVQAESRSVITYDVQRDSWKTLEAKLPTNLVFQVPKQGGLIQTVPQMMQDCKGKILMVGAAYMSGSGNGGDTGIAANDVIDYGVVWELDWSSKAWREIARAPSHMCMHMVEEAMESRKAVLTPIKYSGYADLIIIMASGSQRALQFDVIEEKWAWLDLPSRVNCDLTLCLQPNSIEQF